MEIVFDRKRYEKKLQGIDTGQVFGKITRLVGLTVAMEGIKPAIGEICELQAREAGAPAVKAEVVGFQEGAAFLMPLGKLQGIGPGCFVRATGEKMEVPVGPKMLGRVLDGLGVPLDGRPLKIDQTYPIDNDPPNPLQRQRINEPLPTGVKAIDALLTCGRGQRVGIFAGSGVGKSTLMGMIARYGTADVNVIALIGERGREVREFLEKDLGHEGQKKSVVVVSTSDRPALMRVKAALVATAIAEYFRDLEFNVVLMMDSLTRFAMAQRELGLAAGEPPTTKGYPPSVFSLLPKLLERAGPGTKGSITGFYTVLVDADDLNEPIADAARSILDGHIVLSRELASRNHYPSIDVLNSVSRIMPDVSTVEHRQLAGKLRNQLAIYRRSEDLINIGAYEKGTDPQIDGAIQCYDGIMSFLRQGVEDYFSFDEMMMALEKAVALP